MMTFKTIFQVVLRLLELTYGEVCRKRNGWVSDLSWMGGMDGMRY